MCLRRSSEEVGIEFGLKGGVDGGARLGKIRKYKRDTFRVA